MSEIIVNENAFLDHYKLQMEHQSGYHIACTHVHQERDSQYINHYIALGGKLSRQDINVRLNASGITCTLNGLFIGVDNQHLDTRSYVEHASPHCHSQELYKGILDGNARGVFNGNIYVYPHAIKTDAVQMNSNLLLSDLARIDTRPVLEIFADDVKCTHGGTVGKLDEEAVFYLRSRGISEPDARDILIHAFANEVLETMNLNEIREYADRLIVSRLSTHR